MAKRERPLSGSPVRKSNGANGAATSGKRVSSGATRPSTAAPLRIGPAADAVTLFEFGMKALQRHAFSEAVPYFQDVLSHFPSEGGLCDRSQVYMDLCRREMTRRPAAPRTIEERLTAATAALNDERDDDAESLARSVLAEAPRHELALYLLAAVEARRGSMTSALQLLMQAADVSPEIRAQARHDADFEELRDLEAFKHLIEAPPPTPAAVPSTRARRGRAER